jgi:hypothetical protein
MARLWQEEDFNCETEVALESHPFILAAEAGSLTGLTQRRACCFEQYAIRCHIVCLVDGAASWWDMLTQIPHW